MPSLLSASVAEKLLRADFANIARKLKAGRTLTRDERRLLGEHNGESPTFAKTYVELAEILGVARRTLQRWRRIEGAPKPSDRREHDVEAWRAFQTRIGGKGAGNEADDLDDDLPAEPILRRRKLLLWCQERELALELRRGELIDAALVDENWSANVDHVADFLRANLDEKLAERLATLSAAEIHGELSGVVDGLCKAMNGGGKRACI